MKYLADWKVIHKEFIAELKCHRYYPGRSSVHYMWTDKDGVEYSMHQSDFFPMFLDGKLNNGYILAKWKVVKKGSSYGIKYLSEVEKCSICSKRDDLIKCSNSSCKSECCPSCVTSNGECKYCSRGNIFV